MSEESTEIYLRFACRNRECQQEFTKHQLDVMSDFGCTLEELNHKKKNAAENPTAELLTVKCPACERAHAGVYKPRPSHSLNPRDILSSGNSREQEDRTANLKEGFADEVIQSLLFLGSKQLEEAFPDFYAPERPRWNWTKTFLKYPADNVEGYMFECETQYQDESLMVFSSWDLVAAMILSEIQSSVEETLDAISSNLEECSLENMLFENMLFEPKEFFGYVLDIAKRNSPTLALWECPTSMGAFIDNEKGLEYAGQQLSSYDGKCVKINVEVKYPLDDPDFPGETEEDRTFYIFRT